MAGARYRSGRNPWPWITRDHRARRGRWARTATGVAVAVAMLTAVWILAGPVYAIGTGGAAAAVWRIAR